MNSPFWHAAVDRCGTRGARRRARRARRRERRMRRGRPPVRRPAHGAKRFAAPAEWNLVNRNVSQNPTISQWQAIFVIDLKIKLMK
ncbi:hypothetical protein [Burkholderia pseudomallei]|uniref:hypothetical protein n=1 Tax=Burkholderia pseudomallei TaxID=28450 RepID=UPI001F61804A|nr:hypothetical protein [Burkholderia pseudomallei]